MKKLGFTLAEVLITLAIIGVVAAMTVPALMTSTRGKEYEVGANKALSTISNSITMRVALDNTPPSAFSGGLGAYLVAPPGGIGGDTQGALPTTNSTVAFAVGSVVTTQATVVLKDGMIVRFNPAGALTNTCTVASPCVINVDTNGTKGPTRSTVTSTLATGTTAQQVRDSNGAYTTARNGYTTATTTLPNSNASPDVISLRIRDTIVDAADQRTKNILSSGSALISQ